MSDLQKAGVFLVAENANVFFGDMNKAADAVNAFSDTTDKVGGRVSGAGEIMIGALRKVGEIAVETFVNAGKAAIGFVKDSISAAGDFEAGMNRFQAAAGKAVDPAGLKQFRQLFIDLGKELPVSTKEVEDAATEMVTGGIDPAIIAAGGLRQTIQFAAAAQLNLKDAAATSAKILAGWTDPAASAEVKAAALAAATDDLTKAAAASSTTVAELRLGLFNVQGAAQALHVPFQDTVATLADLAPAFESSAQAGTAFNVFLNRLVPQTNPATDAMKELGIITKQGQNLFFDAQGSFLGMANAAQVLKEHLSGLSDQQKINYLHTLFGQDAQKVANLLMEQGAAGIDTMKAKMADANGVQAQAAIMQSGYNTAMENFKGSVEALQITIGSALLPVLTDLFNNVLAPGINILTDLADGGKVSESTFSKLSPTMQEVARVIEDVFHQIEDGVAIAEQWIGTARDIISSFQSTGDASSDLGKYISQLGDMWKAYYDTTMTIVNAVWLIIQQVFGIIQTFLEQNNGEIEAFLKQTWDSIYTIVMTATELIRGIVVAVFLVIRDFLNEHGKDIQNILKNAWTIISNIIGGVLDIIKGLLTAALKIFQGDWQGAWDAIRTMSESVVKRLWEIIKAGLDLIANFFGTTLDGIQKTWSDNWHMLVSIVERVGRDIYNAGAAFIENLWNGMKAKWDEFKGWLEAQWQSVRDILPGSEPKDTSSPLYGLGDAGAAFIENILGGMQQALPSLLNFVSDMGDKLVASIDDANRQIARLMQSAYSGQANFARTQAQNLTDLATAQKELDPRALMGLQSRLNDAMTESQKIADPKAAAEYYDLLSRQAFEFADLQQQYFEAQDAGDAQRLLALGEQLRLIDQAQMAERAAFQEGQKAQENPFLALHDQIQELVSSMNDLPAELSAQMLALLTYLAELATGIPAGGVTPPATPQQLYAGAAGGTSNTYGPTYNLGMTTSQSPQVVLQGFWLMQAGAL